MDQLGLFGSRDSGTITDRDTAKRYNQDDLRPEPRTNDRPPFPDSGVLEAIDAELSAFGVHGICVFWSYPQGRWGEYSDYDFTILCDSLPRDVHERESYSPRIKDALRKSGIPDICAFNLYNAWELRAARRNRSWLPATMRKGYWIMRDDKGALREVLADDPDIVQTGSFIWQGIGSERIERLERLSGKYAAIATHLISIPAASAFYGYESERIEQILKLYAERKIFPTRAELEELPLRLSASQRRLQDGHSKAKDAWYWPGSDDLHQAAAEKLSSLWLAQEALLHRYLSVKTRLLQMLWSRGAYPIEGEVTQIFLRDMEDRIDPWVLADIRAVCYKSEQVLGRCGYISFDLDADWNGIFADARDVPLLGRLAHDLKRLSEKIDSVHGVPETLSRSAWFFLPNDDLAVISRSEYEADIADKADGAAKRVLRLILPEKKNIWVPRPLGMIRAANYLGISEGKIRTPRTNDLRNQLFSDR